MIAVAPLRPVVLLALLTLPALPAAAAGQLSAKSVSDPHSFARPAEARVTHVALDLTADFRARTLAGTATLDIARAPGAREIVLDTDGLTIERVTDQDGNTLRHRLAAADPILGRALHVSLGGQVRQLRIRYRTAPAATALQWLTPVQTAGRKHPFLYTQGQSIFTRTWIPTQDSPGIRQTYSATITVPEPLRAVMSAEHLTPDGRRVEGGRAFDFRMEQPIPAYLIALAIGDLAFAPIGLRTGVFAEPAVLDAAVQEFGDLDRMLAAAEALYGPYRWGRYDILVMPPSFPFGGMENPRLTFASPTILAGDRSLTALAAHELAHSWSGNLVTNATWEHFWLNEGFTTYFENRIMEALYGADRARMLERLDRLDLQAELATLPAGDTRLVIDLDGRDPEEGLTSVPYNKGAAFLRMLETAIGRDAFDRWLRGYFDRHAFGSQTSEGFRADFREHALEGDAAREQALNMDAWLHEPGLPANATEPQSPKLREAAAEAARFLEGAAAGDLDTAGWITQEWQQFLAALLPARLSDAQLADLDRAFGLSRRGNSEVLFAWLRLVVRNHYRPGLPALERFLTGMGRTKFVKPLFEELVGSDWGRSTARTIYTRARPMYHATTRKAVEELAPGLLKAD